MSLESFHPAVRNWFEKTFKAPTEIQEKAWPLIRQDRPVLIAAPTGSGKTLAAFLAVLDDLIRQGLQEPLADGVDTIYVSPLKALTYDIQLNLEKPLEGIKKELEILGLPPVALRSLVRTGDTSPADRQALVKRPPQILVTTPESLYLLLTSKKGRAALSTARRVIVDEVHALAPNKRGSHLALSLERLDHLCGRKLIRIGLSATQKPMSLVAEFLMGIGEKEYSIIDLGHSRKMDLELELPGSPLEAVMSGETWTEVYDRLTALILAHKTTLVFVNTRRMAERLAKQLEERLGEGCVTSHHGSLSRERRFDAEQRLKGGKLKALVATASLELGIDVGGVDLVCQIGSPRSISVFLQRAGRSGHSLAGLPKGRLFPLTRDELVESASLLDAVSRGELDALTIPEAPLDILAQQIVAEASCGDWEEEDLYQLARRAQPYRNLSRVDFDAVVKMLSEGFASRRGRAGAFLHYDGVHKRIRGRKGANLAALTSGGAIPDNADFDVILEPSGNRVGSVNEDFAIESMAGDIFQLGNTSWRILRVESGKVRVEDAKGQPPTLPFWLGEAPGRTKELSTAVSRLRAEVSRGFALPLSGGGEGEGTKTLPPPSGGRDFLRGIPGITNSAADQIHDYLSGSQAALGVMPTQEDLVVERFFDEVGDQHLVLHSPFGARFNRAWGLALRKRFCRQFNFELQAAAGEDAILISLGPTHSFPLLDVFRFLSSQNVRAILTQALLAAPMFQVRWRWNANRSLAVPRWRGGRKNPPALQRMQSEDLLALVFPQQLACAENIVGDREIPDHPLVRQTVHDCLTEAMDVDSLEAFLSGLESGAFRIHAKDMKEPSPLAAEILNARPYAFLDDAPLEERRSRAVVQRRFLDNADAKDLGHLDPSAIESVRAEAWPQPESADEVHDALMILGFVTEGEGTRSGWEDDFKSLVADHRACSLPLTGGGEGEGSNGPRLWVAAERRSELESALSGTHESLVEILRGRLQGLGPVTEKDLALPLSGGGDETRVSSALLTLESEGFVLRMEGGLWCERRLLARIHRATVSKLRRDVEPVSSQDFMRYLLSWQDAAPDSRLDSPEGLAKILEKLEGWSAPGPSWEKDILPVRMNRFEPSWLDNLCLSGRWVWLASSPSTTLTRSTPISLIPRDHLDCWLPHNTLPLEGGRAPAQRNTLPFSRGGERSPVACHDLVRKEGTATGGGDGKHSLCPPARAVHDHLSARGASFFGDIAGATGLLPSQAEDGLAELAAKGLITADSFQGLRALLSRGARSRSYTPLRPSASRLSGAGRWSLIPSPLQPAPRKVGGEEDSTTEHIARLLLRRYGIVFKRLLEREEGLPPWRDILKVYWTLEARGEIRGGRFVDGFSGEQYALPEAVDLLRFLRRRGPDGSLVSISACDPLNMAGILIPGDKVPALRINRLLYRDGAVVATRARTISSLAPGLNSRSLWTKG